MFWKGESEQFYDKSQDWIKAAVMGRPENGVGGKIGEKTKGLGLSPEAIAKLRQVQDFPKFRLDHNLFAATVKTCSN